MNLKQFKLILILFFIFGIAPESNSQSVFAPLGAYWNYNYYAAASPYSAEWSVKVTKDTLIDGYPTKTLTRFYTFNWGMPNPPPPPHYGSTGVGQIQLRNDSVFIYDPNPTLQKFQYSFIMNVGDNVAVDTFNNSYQIVDSIGQTIINNDTLLEWYLTIYCSGIPRGNNTIIENIGPVNDYLTLEFDNGKCSHAGTADFQCYASSSLNYNQPCWQTLDEPEIIKQEFSIYPNPFNDRITIESPTNNFASLIQIFDITGKLVYENKLFDLKQEIIISHLSRGNYVLKVNEIHYLITK